MIPQEPVEEEAVRTEQSSVSDLDLIISKITQMYGDVSVTPLDLIVAHEILTALREAGWADRETVAALVASAGGQIHVQERFLTDPPKTLEIVPMPQLDGIACKVVSS